MASGCHIGHWNLKVLQMKHKALRMRENKLNLFDSYLYKNNTYKSIQKYQFRLKLLFFYLWSFEDILKN